MCRLPVVSNMTIFVILIYDRKKHTAKINWKGTLWTGTRSMRVPMRSVEGNSETLLESYYS